MQLLLTAKPNGTQTEQGKRAYSQNDFLRNALSKGIYIYK